MTPPSGPSSPVSIASAPVIMVCTRARGAGDVAGRQLAERAFRPLRPALRLRGPGAARGPLGGLGHVSSLAISWRTTGSSMAPVSFARSQHQVDAAGALRIPLVGLHVGRDLGPLLVVDPALGGRRPAPSGACRQRRAARASASSSPPPSRRRPRRPDARRGTSASVKNTWLNEAWPFICRSGCTSTPGCRMSRTK